MWQHVALLSLGLLLLYKGSDLCVSGAKRVADKYGIAHSFIGLTLLSVGTSLPEIFTNVYSGIEVHRGVDASGIAVGTVIGSEVGQITLILGVTALVGSLRAERHMLRREGLMLLLAVAALFVTGLDGHISRLEGALLCAGYVAYLVLLVRSYGVVDAVADPGDRHSHTRTGHELLRIAAGVIVLVIGTTLVVQNAVSLATDLGIASSLIGVLVIGLGTSLPELSIAVAGVRNQAAAVSLGSLLGSNITDPTLSMGSGAVISGFDFDRALLRFDVPFWFGATVIALLLLRGGELGKQDRRKGGLLIALFVLFAALKLTVGSA